MAREIFRNSIEVRCTCDRCGTKHVRMTDGDIGLPIGWSFLHVSVYSNRGDGAGALLCTSCVAAVITAAAPAQLDVDNGS